VAASGLARGDLAITHVAELYRRAIIDQAGGELVRRRVVHDMGLAAHDVGVGLDSEAARTLRTDLRDSGL
jgi:hypothetical protein